MEIKVAERTSELNDANCKLRQEIEVRRKAEKERHSGEMLLSSTFDALQDLVIVIDKDLRVMMSNWKDHEHVPIERPSKAIPIVMQVVYEPRNTL